MSAGAKLRALLAADGIAAAPGAHDAMSARLIAAAGLPAVYLGGNAMAMGLGKGQPFLTLTETADLTARVTRGVEVPVIVDAGAGFGDLSHLDLAVREIEAAGAAGLHIDDQPYPKSADYHRGRGQLVPVDEMAARIRTAVKARRSADLVIIARIDALRVTRSAEEVAARCRASVDAGADALLVLDAGVEDTAAIRAAAGDTPLIWIGGVHPPVPSLDELAAAGFKVALYPFNGVAAVTAALADLWEGLARNGRVDQPDALLARARRDTPGLVGMDRAFAILDGTN